MKYLIIFVIMSIAGATGVIKSNEVESMNTPIPVEYIDFEKPVYITAYV